MPLPNQDFAGDVLKYGFREGVIVTEAPVWIYFGYNFGQSLLQELSTGGKQLADAVLKTRRHYFAKRA